MAKSKVLQFLLDDNEYEAIKRYQLEYSNNVGKMCSISEVLRSIVIPTLNLQEGSPKEDPQIESKEEDPISEPDFNIDKEKNTNYFKDLEI